MSKQALAEIDSSCNWWQLRVHMAHLVCWTEGKDYQEHQNHLPGQSQVSFGTKKDCEAAGNAHSFHTARGRRIQVKAAEKATVHLLAAWVGGYFGFLFQ